MLAVAYPDMCAADWLFEKTKGDGWKSEVFQPFMKRQTKLLSAAWRSRIIIDDKVKFTFPKDLIWDYDKLQNWTLFQIVEDLLSAFRMPQVDLPYLIKSCMEAKDFARDKGAQQKLEDVRLQFRCLAFLLDPEKAAKVLKENGVDVAVIEELLKTKLLDTHPGGDDMP
jgi:hypothetical protein